MTKVFELKKEVDGRLVELTNKETFLKIMYLKNNPKRWFDIYIIDAVGNEIKKVETFNSLKKAINYVQSIWDMVVNRIKIN